MEVFAKLKLTFNKLPDIGDTISFFIGDVEISETFKAIRTGFGISQVAPNGSIADAVSNLATAIEADYNIGGRFIIETGNNELLLSYTVPAVEFNSISVPAYVLALTIAPDTKFEISDITFLPGSDCSKVKVQITTSLQADEMLAPVQEPITSNPHTFEFDRSVSFEIKLKRGLKTASEIIGMPYRIWPADINLEIQDNPAGSTVKVITGGYGLDLTYSLNGIDYKNGNVFTNLVGGQYIAYVQDQFGCITEKPFELDGFGINSPFFQLSEANSIRFANRVTWGDCANHKNDYNTLSCEVDVPMPYKEIQRFQTCDTIITQFKSNYQSNSVTVNGVPSLQLRKITDYMRRKDRRDAILTNISNGKTGVYFLSGQTYDYDTQDPNGSYSLNGALPEWGKAGNFLQMPDGGWYLIEDIHYSEELNVEMLVISLPPQGSAIFTGIVSSFYNLHNYEVYQHTLDFSNYTDMTVRVRIKGYDNYFGTIEFQSEDIEVRQRHANTVEILYYDDENTDMYYNSGIQNKIRIPIERIDGKPRDDSDTYDTDTGTILLNSDVRKMDTFTFKHVTKQMMWKLVIALSHKIVRIDGVEYVKEEIEVSEALGATNLYQVTATMVQSNSAYKGSDFNFDETGVEIPALIQTGTGFVKYQ